MKAIKFTYNLPAIKKGLAKYYGGRIGRIIGVEGGNSLIVGDRAGKSKLSARTIAEAFGGIYDYDTARVKFVGKGKRLRLHVWKSILTMEEFRDAMRRHNAGFADKGNPRVLSGVIVYSPSASGWKRRLWNCPLKSRSYRTTSAQEVFLEQDPSAGLIRHPYCHLQCLDGGESLLREEWGWKADYCYIEGYAREAAK